MKILDNLLVLPICIQPASKSVSTVSNNNPVWQTIPNIHCSISKRKLAQVIFKTSFEDYQIITLGSWMPVVFKFGTTFVSYFPESIL